MEDIKHFYDKDSEILDVLENCLLTDSYIIRKHCENCPLKNVPLNDCGQDCRNALFNMIVQRMNDHFNELEAEKRHHEVLKRFCLGKWQDTEKVEAALDIDWDEGTKRFKWGRIANWNPRPWNGQYVITKYRLKDSEEPWPDEHWRNIKTDPDREGEYRDDSKVD